MSDAELVQKWKNNPRVKEWIDAGKILAVDPSASVDCPDCGKAKLEVVDGRSGELLERWMKCPACGSFNTLRMIRPPEK